LASATDSSEERNSATGSRCERQRVGWHLGQTVRACPLSLASGRSAAVVNCAVCYSSFARLTPTRKARSVSLYWCGCPHCIRVCWCTQSRCISSPQRSLRLCTRRTNAGTMCSPRTRAVICLLDWAACVSVMDPQRSTATIFDRPCGGNVPWRQRVWTPWDDFCVHYQLLQVI